MNYTRRFDPGEYDAVVFDLDGTLWLGGAALPGAPAFVQRCRAAGARVMAATNISVGRAADVAGVLVDEDLLRSGEPVMTAGLAVASAVASADVRRVAVLGGEGLHHELRVAGMDVVDIVAGGNDSVDVVVMGGWPEARLADIETAGRLAAAGAPMYVTSLEPGFPLPGGYQPGAGMMIAAVQALYPSVQPIVCGKPSSGYAAAVLAELGHPERVLMVGDSLAADVGLAAAMGADSLWLHHGRALPVGIGRPSFTARDLQSDIEGLEDC